MKEKIRLYIESVCTFLALSINIDIYEKIVESGSFDLSLFKLGFIGSLAFLLLIVVFYKKYSCKSNIYIKGISLLFSLFMIFGNSYANCGNTSLVFGNGWLFILSILMAIGYYSLFKLCIGYIFEYLDKPKIKKSTKKVMTFFEEHPFLFSITIIFICWLPYIIAFYPIILSPDPSYQIKQFFGIRTKYADYAVLLDENVVLTNHHPVLHTLLIGGCLKIGTLLGNDNLGLFFYSIIQITLFSSTLAYTIKYLIKNLKLSNKIGLVVLLVYSFVPMFPFYAMSGVKDVIFSTFVILYVIMLHKIISNNGNGFKKWHYVIMVLLMLLVILFRNNGLYVILLSFPFLILVVRKKWKTYLIIFIITIGLSTCYSKVLLPAFKITSGSIREVLSIPFQQTARYVKYHSDELSKSDIEIIDNVLVYEDLATRYKPEISDPVKNKYNKYTTSDELKDYFKVWLKGLVKHPVTYIDATIENVYGYFYPEKTNWYIYYKFDSRITSDGFDYHYNSLDNLRESLVLWANVFVGIPIIGLLSNIGFSTWIVLLLVCYILYKKEYKKIVLYLPALISILVCVASPVNTYFRYAIPYIFCLPLMIGFVLEKEKY
ncbi:MAG: DUF6020 family protein [Candidatus Coprovivens sp.]